MASLKAVARLVRNLSHAKIALKEIEEIEISAGAKLPHKARVKHGRSLLPCHVHSPNSLLPFPAKF